MNTAFLDNYRFLARYNRWMNQRLYQACETLSDEERKRERGAFFGSIHHTLTHLVLADKMWLQRFAAQPTVFAALPSALLAMPEGSDYSSDLHPDWEDLKHARKAVDAAIELWLAEMSPDFLLGTMHYANTKGVPRAHPAWQAMTHFFNHQTHHRAQAGTLLTQAGVDIGVTDLIALV
ncbi:DinB family protein [Polaromonas sp. SM01]|uniref:DinB family protein n=1 Tax=Polaromonas sp. SM01 TaxID=3085630 RepID=UPI002982A416|nr:DinB family protein [Polaromonas sp. SM01]MDW5444567.1 DinB family protein [Polaromonas sp. SM01]